MKLHALTHSAPSDCVLVHGAGGNDALWGDVLPSLSGDGRAFALNLPGHPSGEITCKTVAEYAEVVYGFMTESRLEPVLCGHSMGGAVAMSVALSHPDSIRGLILISTGAKLGVLPDVIAGLQRDPLGVIERTITPLSFHRLDLGMARRARAALSLSNPSVFYNDYTACAGFDVRSRLGDISLPTLIICGDDDRMTPPKWSQFLHTKIASSKTPVIVGEAGHMLPLEKPAECGRLIQGFLAEFNP